MPRVLYPQKVVDAVAEKSEVDTLKELNDRLYDRVVQLEDLQDELLKMLDGYLDWPDDEIDNRIQRVINKISREVYGR